jgi:hypothetical protein
MFITRLLHSKTGKYMLSILLGMGFASFFRKACKGKDCIDYSAPPVEEMEGKNYKFDGKCYEYYAEPVSCNTDKTIISSK